MTTSHRFSPLFIGFFLLLLGTLSTCSGFRDEVEARFNALESRVSDLESATLALRKAYENGKIIKSVTPLAATAGQTAGHRITFSDDSFIDLFNGQKGETGEKGDQGIQGEKGDKGDTGETGAQGIQGEKGDKGDKGDTGAQGEKGDTGAAGLNGLDGANGADGITPFVKVDADGYWAVSYDSGSSWSRLVDETGQPLVARGEKGEKGDKVEQGDKGEQGEKGDKGDQGEQGTQGPKGPQGDKGATGSTGQAGRDGQDGTNGLGVRVAVDESGHYVLETYASNNPAQTLSRMTTPLSAQSNQLLQSVTTDEGKHLVTLTLRNGEQFRFAQFVVVPTSIAILETSPRLLAKGGETTIEFRVNPSNASFNYDVDDPNCEIALDLLGRTRANNYVTRPDHHRLAQIELVYDAQGVQRVGQYRATIVDLNNAASYRQRLALVLNCRDAKGDEVQISSSAFELQSAGDQLLSFSLSPAHNAELLQTVEAEIEGNQVTLTVPYLSNFSRLVPSFSTNAKVYVDSELQQSGQSAQDFSRPVTYQLVGKDGQTQTYMVTIRNTGLPVLHLTSPAQITSKDEWTAGCTMRIVDNGVTTNYGQIEMKGRGNTTWAFPKKPYALRLGQKAEGLGMAPHKRWVLLANWLDRTLIRNDIGLELARQTSLEWTPSGRFVEVVFNGRFVGNYYLCEQIRVDKNRLDINTLNATDIEEPNITGGYLLEFDKYYDEVNKFRTKVRDLPCNIKYPDDDDIQPQQLAYIEQYVNQLEDELYKFNAFSTRNYRNYLDLNSVIDHWLALEVAGHSENYAPKSIYAYKKRNGLLTMGPVWDFDYDTFTPRNNQRFAATYGMWMQRIIRDPQFWSLVRERWAELRDRFKAVEARIEQQREYLRLSNEANIAIWPIYERVNGDETLSYDAAIDRIIEQLRTKIAYLDREIANAR